MKKSLLIVVALLAVSALLAASAYTTAVVESPGQVSVVNSSAALLALIPSDYHNAANEVNGRLDIDLDNGIGFNDFGVQRGSSYVWTGLFAIKNNSENDIKVFVDIDDTNLPSELSAGALYFKNGSIEGNWVQLTGDGVLEFNLRSGGQESIDFKIETDEDVDLGQYNFTLIVKGMDPASPQIIWPDEP
jgi:hypothetical protein